MDWFYKKVNPEFDAKQIEDLASKLEGSKIRSSWLGRKVVLGKEDLSPKIKAVLNGIKANLDKLEGEGRIHAIKLLTNVDNLYNTAGKVGWFNPTGKAAKSLKGKLEERAKEDLLDQCDEKCLEVSNEQTIKNRPKELIEVFKKLLDCKDPDRRLSLKKEIIQLVYGFVNAELLKDEAFVEKVWDKTRNTLCIQRHPFFKSLRKGPQVIVSSKNDEAKGVYQQLAKRSRNQSPKKVKLGEGIEVQVPGDFEDSVRRTVFRQIDNIKGSYNQLDSKVKEKVSQDSLGGFSREELSEVFLLDLRAKLGPSRESLIEPLLVSIEQACDNYGFEEIASQMNKPFGNEIYQTLENPIRHVVKIKISKDEDCPIEALIESDYPMRIQDFSDKSGIIRKFTPMEVRSTLTLKFKIPKEAPTSLSDYCEEVSLVVSESKTPIDEMQYLIVSA